MPRATEHQWMTVRGLSKEVGYTENAIRIKCQRDVWRQGIVWKKAPDGKIVIDYLAVQRWMKSNPRQKPISRKNRKAI